MSGTEQGVQPQDPQAASAPVAEPVAPPAVAQPAPSAEPRHPWDQDLSFITSDEERAKVSDYLATTWQPRVTQLEQSSKPAVELYNDFSEKPKDTLVDVARELYGADVATAFSQYLDEVEGSPNPVTPQADQPTGDQPARDPEVQAIIDWKKNQDEQAAFDAEFARVQEANPGVYLDRDLFIPEVAETGNFDQAVQVYAQKYADYLQFRQQQATAVAEPQPTPPNTLGSGEATGAGEVQTAPQNQTLHEAIDDFFEVEAQRGSAGVPAPPVSTG